MTNASKPVRAPFASSCQESLAHASEPSGVHRVFPNRHVPVAAPQEPQDA